MRSNRLRIAAMVVRTLLLASPACGRENMFDALLPSSLADQWAPAKESLGEVFARRLRRNESRYADLVRREYPGTDAWTGRYDPDAMAVWRGRVVSEQERVLIKTAEEAARERYDLLDLERAAGDYVLDPRRWEAAYLAEAGLVTGALVYANGFHATARVAGLRVGLSLRPAWRGGSERLAAVELERGGVTVTASRDRRGGQSVALGYALRY